MSFNTLLLAAVVGAGFVVNAPAARAESEGNHLAAVEVPAGTGIYETVVWTKGPNGRAEMSSLPMEAFGSTVLADATSRFGAPTQPTR